MARANILRNTFTAGEISPRLASRAGLAAKESGCLELVNAVVLKEGGLVRRPGLQYIASTKNHAKRSRLFPFRFSVTQAYIIEAGESYFRFYMNGGQIVASSVPYEVASTYTEAQVQELTITQSFDVLYLLHPAHPPRTLSRTGHTAWVLSDIAFSPPMTAEDGTKPATTLTLSATTGTINLTAGASTWLASDVDRLVEAGGGQATITSITSATVAVATVNRAFPSTSFAAQAWTLAGSPVATLTPDKKEPVGATITLTLGAAGWRSTDVGRFVDVAGGFIELRAVGSTTSATGVIRSVLSATTAVGGGGWKLRSASWSSTNGYPSCAGFHQQRLAFGGPSADPGRLAASRSADFYAFPLGTKDDDAIEYPLLEDGVHAIRWLKTFGEALAIGTDSGAWVVTSGITDPTITPTTITAAMHTPYGAAAGFMARRIASAMVYVPRSKKALRALSYSFQSDAYAATDLTVLASHALRSGIADWTHQEEPEQVIWVARADGQLVGCTWLPEHEVNGWHRHVTAGAVESVAVIPGDPDDELWCVVRRTIGGQTKRYVERMADRMTDSDPIEAAFFVDSGLTYRGSPATTIIGLGHLEGQTVRVLADGMVLPDLVVTSGAITLSHPASVVTVGLGYDVRIRPCLPDVGSQDGTTLGRRRRVIRAVVDGLRATQCWVGPDDAHLVQVDDVTARQLDQPVDTFTGDVRALPDNSYDDAHNLLIVHRLPAPFEIRALAILVEASSS